ncbi:NYN domain-containing protein [Arcobacter sp. FWKO B]|uniref:NYN domain-containing protein n=1 Tax=Arcobacter sp. FWKO B TaxID=2593672 RepID=UPI0018A384F2|nr:NYN domain-containing protein [Arcobacter sp. FWKO B]QOG11642.1 NYN domain-containing protein [Arcobacter sp. FWKO B]
MSDKEMKLAILIDADNTSHNVISPLLDEISKYGTPTVKRIYGDWTENQLSGWKPILLQKSIIPIQQFAYTSGKNSTDIAMIIDAMDLLYTHNYDGFCLVSSDSDFTRLASRIRESGIKVFGFGRQNTPISFVSACDKFIYIETIEKQRSVKDDDKLYEELSEVDFCAPMDKEKLKLVFTKIVNDLSDEDGWARLDSVGTQIHKIMPQFDVRSYEMGKLSQLLTSLELFEFKKRKTKQHKTKELFVRLID